MFILHPSYSQSVSISTERKMRIFIDLQSDGGKWRELTFRQSDLTTFRGPSMQKKHYRNISIGIL